MLTGQQMYEHLLSEIKDIMTSSSIVYDDPFCLKPLSQRWLVCNFYSIVEEVNAIYHTISKAYQKGVIVKHPCEYPIYYEVRVLIIDEHGHVLRVMSNHPRPNVVYADGCPLIQLYVQETKPFSVLRDVKIHAWDSWRNELGVAQRDKSHLAVISRQLCHIRSRGLAD
jgi:hypothetical protein